MIRMARKLDIIVTHYREPWEVGKQLFDMIECQRGINFDDIRVLLIQDGNIGTLWSGHVTDYSYYVMPIGMPHGGVSAARNAGLYSSDAEWVMFCDFDDAFYTTYSLAKFFKEMKDGINMIVSKFYWEAVDPEGRIRLREFEGTDCVFVHGKMFRRQWLVDNNLHFDDALTIHEDSYFVTLAELVCCEGEIAKIKDPTYLWQHNTRSVTKSYADFTLQTFDHWTKKTRHLINELARRGIYGGVRIVLCDALVDTYANFNSVGWNLPELAEDKAKALAEYEKLLAEYEDSIFNLPRLMFDQRIEIRCTEENGLIPGSPTFYEWMNERMKRTQWT